MTNQLPNWYMYVLTGAIISIMIAVFLVMFRIQAQRKVKGKALADIWTPSERVSSLVKLEATPKEGIYQFEYEGKTYNFITKYQRKSNYPVSGIMSHLGTTVMSEAYEENIPDPLLYRADGKYEPKDTGEVIKARVGQRTLEINMRASQEIEHLQEQQVTQKKWFTYLFVFSSAIIIMQGVMIYLNVKSSGQTMNYLQAIATATKALIVK